mgnify:CR=1 FL=1
MTIAEVIRQGNGTLKHIRRVQKYFDVLYKIVEKEMNTIVKLSAKEKEKSKKEKKDKKKTKKTVGRPRSKVITKGKRPVGRPRKVYAGQTLESVMNPEQE